MINSGTGNRVTNDDFLQVLLALKKNIMNNTGVAEVAQIVNVKEDFYSCKILSTGMTVPGYSLKGLNVNVNDIIVLIFTDTDFRSNLKRIKKGQPSQEITQEVLHTKDCGIIIGILYKEDEQNDNE